MLRIGTSGWQYADWRGVFYPASLAQGRWLEHYSGHFATVELNVSFYRLPARESFAKWRATARTGFLFAAKMSRYLTHIKRLADPAEPVARFLDRAEPLGDALGPVLIQLPPTLPADAGLLDAVLAEFPPHIAVAVEPRHPSWWSADIRRVLERRGAALCWADRRGRPITPLWRTANFAYVRLHEGSAAPRPLYGRQALGSWLDRIAEEFGEAHDAFVYFNNDPHGAAVRNADELMAQAHRRSMPTAPWPLEAQP